jgi:hypothetical protein
MKTLFIVNTHSVVDLITNSSSELFVCNSNKTVEAAKDILKELCRLYNEKQKLSDNPYLINLEHLFDTIFGKIYTTNYDFSDSEIYRKWNIVNHYDFGEKSHGYYDSRRNKDDDYLGFAKLKREADKKFEDWKNAQPKAPRYTGSYDEKDPNFNKELFDEHNEKNRIYYKKEQEARQLFYKSFNDAKLSLYKELVTYYAKLNNIDIAQINLFKNQSDSGYFYLDFSDITDVKLKDMLTCFEEAEGWDMVIPKNSLIIESKSDNTIPYDLFDDIEDIFNATRHHLG